MLTETAVCFALKVSSNLWRVIYRLVSAEGRVLSNWEKLVNCSGMMLRSAQPLHKVVPDRTQTHALSSHHHCYMKLLRDSISSNRHKMRRVR